VLLVDAFDRFRRNDYRSTTDPVAGIDKQIADPPAVFADQEISPLRACR
jgi:hypothetical protein